MPQAIPGASVSTPPFGGSGGYINSGAVSSGRGLLRVVSNAQLSEHDRQHRAQAAEAASKTLPVADIGSFIRRRWEAFRNHRNQGEDPINERLLRAQRMFEGRYDASKIAEIAKFGGSQVYARTVAVKCRGAASLLRDVYLGPERPWDIQPQPDPAVPPEIQAHIMQLVSAEVQTQQGAGVPVLEEQVHMRYLALMHAAQSAARQNALNQAKTTSDRIEDILVAGGFYEALTEFLTDLPLFPFAVIKGPVVRMVPNLTWVDGKASLKNKAQMFWERISPFDIYWSPGASRISDAEIIQRKRLTRTDLNDLLGLPGYDQDAVRACLEDYRLGLRDWLDAPDTEQAINEGRENPWTNQSQMIDAIEYHGNIQGQMLLDQGVNSRLIKDPDRDYAVQSWVVGRHTLKTILNPSPRQRHPYFMTSFEKVPGTVSGHALPELLEDVQEVTNAAYRSLVNNLAISSGPQVVVNDEMLSPTESGDELYPWKRWHVTGDPMSNQGKPIDFFQPQSNAQELLSVIAAMDGRADETSAIPKYLTGSSLSGGAGRTASGLSMLMGNAEKILQTVAANVDTDCMRPLLTALYDMIMLTDQSGMLTGEEEIRVRGVNVAMQKESERQKQLQFLQITANPIDGPIIGTLGRARVLRAIAQDLGLPDNIVPDDQTLQQQQDAQKQLAAAQAGVPPSPGAPGAPGAPSGGAPGSGSGIPAPPGPGGSGQPSQAKPGTPPGQAAQGNQPPHPGPVQGPMMNSFQQGIPGRASA